MSFLPEGDYDHSLMLVRFLQGTLGKKPFRFFNYWTTRPNFLEVVREVWDTNIVGYPSYVISQKLRLFKCNLKRAFGRSNLQSSVESSQADLLDIQHQMHEQPDSTDLASREHFLSAQLRNLKKDFEHSLRQKAKLLWLKFGDDNTSFFHQSIKHRIRCNRIAVVIEDGREFTDPTMI